MNTFVDKLFLRLVMFFYPVLEKTGVDVYQLHEILRVKLLMDNRRPKNMFATRRRSAMTNQSSPASQWVTLFFVLLMGFFISLLLVFLHATPLLGQSVYFLVFMVLMSLTLISDFTTVLIDTRDQFILLPRPVDDRTIAVSRILHIAIYVLRLALLQGLPGIIIMGIVDKSVFASLLFLVQIIEATFLCILFVNIIYLLLMRSVSPQKFKDAISYFQVLFSSLIFAAYMLPRLLDLSALSHFNLLGHWWGYILPPVWIAALNEVLIHAHRADLMISILAIVGFTLPLAGLWFVAKVLAPGFNKRLAELATSDGSNNTVKTTTQSYRLDLRDRIANLIAPDAIENAGFRMTWKLAARTREFKVKVYPSFAFVLIYFLYFALNTRGGNISQKFNKLQNGFSYLFLVYLSTIVLSNILSNISQSEKYKAAWVYYALPVKTPGKILSGMYKAIIAFYFLPYCTLLTIGMTFIWGPQVINDAILSFLICTTCGMLLALLMVKGLPFSRPVSVKQGGGRMITSMVVPLVIGCFGYGHYLLAKHEIIVWIAIIPAALVTWVMLHYYRKQSWESIELADM